MSTRTAVIVALVATLCVAGGLWWVHPVAAVIYLGTLVQIGAVLLIPVEGVKR